MSGRCPGLREFVDSLGKKEEWMYTVFEQMRFGAAEVKALISAYGGVEGFRKAVGKDCEDDDEVEERGESVVLEKEDVVAVVAGDCSGGGGPVVVEEKADQDAGVVFSSGESGLVSVESSGGCCGVETFEGSGVPSVTVGVRGAVIPRDTLSLDGSLLARSYVSAPQSYFESGKTPGFYRSVFEEKGQLGGFESSDRGAFLSCEERRPGEVVDAVQAVCTYGEGNGRIDAGDKNFVEEVDNSAVVAAQEECVGQEAGLDVVVDECSSGSLWVSGRESGEECLGESDGVGTGVCGTGGGGSHSAGVDKLSGTAVHAISECCGGDLGCIAGPLTVVLKLGYDTVFEADNPKGFSESKSLYCHLVQKPLGSDCELPPLLDKKKGVALSRCVTVTKIVPTDRDLNLVNRWRRLAAGMQYGMTEKRRHGSGVVTYSMCLLKYRCARCPARFGSLEDRKVHNRTHRPRADRVCVCGKEFHDNYNKERHARAARCASKRLKNTFPKLAPRERVVFK